MNREIKFKAWDGIRRTTSGIMFNSTNGFLEIPNGSQMKLMQYTGLKDKNGVEIYESDLIRWESIDNEDTPPISEVKFYDCSFYSERKGNRCLLGSPNGVQNKYIEVIGNIYKNPELLEAKS